jgi:FixJ family two-component response regulator
VRKVLVVDDEVEILDMVKNLLEVHDIAVETLSEASQVLDTTLKFEPDLVILDINLPDGNGIELLKILKEKPLTSFIPVILLTGQSAIDSQITGLISGADDYVTKPFNLNLLYARVVSVLRHSLSHTRLKYDQRNLLNYLVNHYSKRDYKIFTKLSQDYPNCPQYWQGFVPDLIIEKGTKYRCFNFETTQSIVEENFLERLKAMAEISSSWRYPVELNIIVRTKENLRLADKIIEENRLPINVRYFKKLS